MSKLLKVKVKLGQGIRLRDIEIDSSEYKGNMSDFIKKILIKIGEPFQNKDNDYLNRNIKRMLLRATPIANRSFS